MHVYNMMTRIQARSAVETSDLFKRKGGWDLDQFKFFPALKLASELHPSFAFYVMIGNCGFRSL